jgi:branched-chain amino acid transport system permease protein
VLLLLPGFLGDINMLYATRMLPMAIIFVSIVAVTGFSGHITLGQAALAGFGAFISARIANSWGVPIALSTLLGGVGAVALGMVAGFPALRRRGLFLGLTTLALGLLVDRLVFQSPVFAGGINGLVVTRPSFFGLSLENDNLFYYYELIWLAAMLLLARNLRSGRLGRALAAMRDSEAGSRSVGIDLRNYKLFIFGASAFIAGIGGALLSQQGRQFQFLAYNPINSLVWFMVVVVVGVQSIFGAVLGAFLFVMLNVVVKVDGLAELLIGLAALSLGRLPGGSVLGVGRWALERVWIGVERAYVTARREPAPEPVAPGDEPAFDRSLRRTMALAMQDGGGNGKGNGNGRHYVASPVAREILEARGVTWKPPTNAPPAPPEPTEAKPKFAPSPLARKLLEGER